MPTALSLRGGATLRVLGGEAEERAVGAHGDDLLDAAHALADRLAANAPLAARATKEVAARTADMGWTEAVRFGETMRLIAGSTDDAAEGRRAWAEKRRPEWRVR